MNNDELKKKICDIIAPYVSAYGDDEAIADDLIAAGIGDAKEAEHRAEVAERALYNACSEQNKHWCVQCNSFAECDTSNEMCIEAKKHAEELIKQAEKELAEENNAKN